MPVSDTLARCHLAKSTSSVMLLLLGVVASLVFPSTNKVVILSSSFAKSAGLVGVHRRLGLSN